MSTSTLGTEERVAPGSVGARIVVGVDRTMRGDDAVVFARRLAEFAGAELVLASVCVTSDRLGDARNAGDPLQDSALARLSAVRDRLAPGAAITALAETSATRALQTLAERLQAALIVVGRADHRHAGRVARATTGERLFHRTVCPIAVVPRGYTRSRLRPMLRLGVGIDGGPESDAALAAAVPLAHRLEPRSRSSTPTPPGSFRSIPRLPMTSRLTRADNSPRPLWPSRRALERIRCSSRAGRSEHWPTVRTTWTCCWSDLAATGRRAPSCSAEYRAG